MVHEHNLSSVLSEFARTVLTDFRIQAILDRLVERFVDVLSITGAGVTLIAPGMAPQDSEQQREEVLGVGCELAQGFRYA